MARLNKNPLGEFVRRRINEQHLSRHDVSIRSGGLIAESYVSAILNGTCTNVSIDKLKALARGIGADEIELARIALGENGTADQGRLEEPEPHGMVLLDLRHKVMLSSDVAGLVHQLMDLSSRERASVSRFVRRLIRQRQAGEKRNRKRG